MADKLGKLSVYWAAACGGCEISIVNLHEKILDVDANFDFYFCPCLLDTKKKDIEALPDGGITVTLFNGAIRTEENLEMALLLRKKSQLFIAFGSCSCDGGIAAMGNFTSKDELISTVYLDNVSTINPQKVVPQGVTKVPEGQLHIPVLEDQVRTLAQVVDVDYFIPGCPPEPERIWEVLELFIQGKALPPKGSVIGAGQSTVCNQCHRKKEVKKITRLYRTYEIIPDSEQCLLEQGLVCMGVATRDGCGGLCPQVNMPCTGCYGVPEGVYDQGAKMVAALGSIIDIGPVKGLSHGEIASRTDAIINSIPDYVGTFYKYSLASSLLKGRMS